ncbi:MAG: tripartite tricarboxylate transporter substrate-binding protein [Lautropia sp.]
MKATRRVLGGFLLSLGLVAVAVPAAGQSQAAAADFPSRPVHIVVPYAPGGSADKLTRIVAERLAALWGQPVVVENVAGANGMIGAAKVGRSAPDGYTLLEHGENLTLNWLTTREQPREKDLLPIVKAVVNPQILVVNPGIGINTLGDYLERAKAKPGTIALALGGSGGIAHVSHQMITQQTGAQVNYVFYKGGGPATVDVMGGHADATLVSLASVTEFVRAGRLKALAVTTSYRSPALPDVPTMHEAGLKDFVVESWNGFLAPANTPAAIVDKINRDIMKTLESAEVRKQLDAMGFKVAGGPPADLVKTMADDARRFATVVDVVK